MEKRNNKIKQLYKKGLKYKEIGEKFNITSERVRQIIFYNNKTDKEREKILKQLKKEYKNRFNDELSQKNLLEDIEILSKPNRKKEVVMKRNALITYLHEELEISFLSIGILLHKHHTTIIYSYEQYIKNQ